MAAYCIEAAYLPSFKEPAPEWLYLMSGFAVFFYLHMDALDGKQARNTKTSSPLGQLFDHGTTEGHSLYILFAFKAALP